MQKTVISCAFSVGLLEPSRTFCMAPNVPPCQVRDGVCPPLLSPPALLNKCVCSSGRRPPASLEGPRSPRGGGRRSRVPPEPAPPPAEVWV